MSLAEVIDRDVRDIIPAALKQDRRTIKERAREWGTTPRTVENWLGGQNLPQVPHFLMLARDIPELKAKVLEWLDAATAPQDPVIDEIRKLLENRRANP